VRFAEAIWHAGDNYAYNSIDGRKRIDISVSNHLSGADRISDFVIGEDTLKFLDTNGNVIKSTGYLDVSSIQDLAISYLSGELILEAVNAENWGDAFLEII